MINVDPIARPVIIPVELPMVAMAGKLLVQFPPPPSVSIIVEPTHTAVGPEIGAGNGFTIIVALPVILLLQPVPVFVAVTV